MALSLGDITAQVIRLRPDWNGAAVYSILRQARDTHPGADLITIAAVASAIAADRTQRTPSGIAHHPALTGGPIGSASAAGDQTRPSLHPDLTGEPQLCDHGIDQRERTSDDRPRCPYCRGVTRTMRNGSDAPSRVAAHPPLPSVDPAPRPAPAAAQ